MKNGFTEVMISNQYSSSCFSNDGSQKIYVKMRVREGLNAFSAIENMCSDITARPGGKEL